MKMNELSYIYIKKTFIKDTPFIILLCQEKKNRNLYIKHSSIIIELFYINCYFDNKTRSNIL